MKYCTKCGNPVENDENFCTKCGNPVRKKDDDMDIPVYEEQRQPADPEAETIILQKNVEKQAQSGYQEYTPDVTNEYYANTYEDESNGAAVASLILGIISLACMMGIALAPIPFCGTICGLIGTILGANGRKKQVKQGMATAGMVCSIIGLVCSGLCLVACGGCVGCLALSSL